jgi:heptosyltransferase-1
MKKVLIIKMWALGDILMATPMISALNTTYPGVKVSWLVDIEHAELLANHPGIDELIVIDSGKWRRLYRKGNLLAWIKRTYELNAQIKGRGFDAVINCLPEKWWSIFLCGAPNRVALYPFAKFNFMRRFYTTSIGRPRLAGIHTSEHDLMATAALGCGPGDKKMTLGETPEERPFVVRFCAEHGLDHAHPFFILAPFSTAENRSWEPALAAEIADWLAEEYQAQVVLTAGPKEIARAHEIKSLAKSRIDIAEGTTLRQYIGLLRHSDLVVTGDSSPMHIAAALDKPYVALFGPTPSAERKPLMGNGITIFKPLPCAPCDDSVCSNPVFRQCMKLIGLRDVQDAVRTLLPHIVRGGTV